MSLTRRPSIAEDKEQKLLKKQHRSSLGVDPEDEVSMVTGSSSGQQKDADQVSLLSRGSVLSSSLRGAKGEDMVALVAHGICDVGKLRLSHRRPMHTDLAADIQYSHTQDLFDVKIHSTT